MPARAPESDDTLKRERAGTYRTRDGRFTIEGSSSGWLLLDAEQTDELGLPLARGPFGTLDEAKIAIGPARTGPRPTSGLKARPAASRARGTLSDASTRTAMPTRAPGKASGKAAAGPSRSTTSRADRVPKVVIRGIRIVDGDALRALWADAGFRSLGDDDKSLARLARRNPALVLVAAEGSRVVGSALGAWDGRRGWIYHVATATSHRRQGIATRLIAQIEAGLRALGCPKVNVMIRGENDDGREFWTTIGYGPGVSRQYAKELDAG